MLCDRKGFWDTELEQELQPVLERLRQTGEISGASCGFNLIAPGRVYYTLTGQTFQIAYIVDSAIKQVRFYEFQQVSHPIDWKTALQQDLRNGEDQPVYIPQDGDPRKFIKTVELIHCGINTPKGIGVAIGSRAKEDKNVARKGYYLGRALIELDLVSRDQGKKGSLNAYVLTDRGKRIAQSNDEETRERLLAEALLGFYPIQVIIAETTTRGNKELTKELIQDIIFRVSLGDCGGTTNPRRASSLRALVNWVSRWAGIPIRRAGNDGIQFYIPYIYANQTI